MKNSVSESILPQEYVGSYLREAMPHCEFTYESLVGGYPPLILMWMTHNMAAFAFEERGDGESYERLYGSFRDYYAKNRGRLDVYDRYSFHRRSSSAACAGLSASSARSPGGRC